MKRRLDLDPRTVALPKGTRVVLTADLPARDGWIARQGVLGRVEEVDHPRYVVATTDGHTVDAKRGHLVVQNARLADVAGERQWSWETFADDIVLEVVVGSTAWGLADEDSDVDLRGAFLLPFDHHAGLWSPPEELAPAGQEASYWEVEKLIRQALRADANSLEVLWSPLVRKETAVGAMLRDQRRLFLSRRIHGSFGRYAIGQLEKMRRRVEQHDTEGVVVEAIQADPTLDEAALVAELVAAGLGDEAEATRRLRRVAHAYFDRGLIPSRAIADLQAHLVGQPPEREAWRPKNAYNLLRLLHSGIRLAREGEPLMRVEDEALRARLLQIKRGQADLAGVIAEARELAAELDHAVETSALPEEPDLEGADRLLRAARSHAARRVFALPTHHAVVARPPALGPAVEAYDLPAARAFAEQIAGDRDIVLCALTGAHAYGFPSPDSDLDLKGIFLATAADLLGLDGPPASVDRLEVRDGLELDLTLNEAAKAVTLLLRGNGNMHERLTSPYQVLPVPGASAQADERLAELRALGGASLHRGVHRHYRGFLKQAIAAVRAAPTVKGWLYAYRVALTGLHALRAEEVVSDLRLLLEDHRLPHVHELIAAKRAGAERDGVGAFAGLVDQVERELNELAAEMDAARDSSPLPEEAPNRAALDDWLRWWRTVRL